jgi:zinc transporter ZupT
MFLVLQPTSKAANIVEHITWLLILLMPIILIWRYKFKGFLLALVGSEIVIILSDILATFLRSQKLNDEDREYWLIMGMIILFYCLSILFFRLFLIFIRFLIKMFVTE